MTAVDDRLAALEVRLDLLVDWLEERGDLDRCRCADLEGRVADLTNRVFWLETINSVMDEFISSRLEQFAGVAQQILDQLQADR